MTIVVPIRGEVHLWLLDVYSKRVDAIYEVARRATFNLDGAHIAAIGRVSACLGLLLLLGLALLSFVAHLVVRITVATLLHIRIATAARLPSASYSCATLCSILVLGGVMVQICRPNLPLAVRSISSFGKRAPFFGAIFRYCRPEDSLLKRVLLEGRP